MFSANLLAAVVGCGWKLQTQSPMGNHTLVCRFSILTERRFSHQLLFSDINECRLGIADCEQECINTAGSFLCRCAAGFQLSADFRTCEGVCACVYVCVYEGVRRVYSEWQMQIL